MTKGTRSAIRDVSLVSEPLNDPFADQRQPEEEDPLAGNQRQEARVVVLEEQLDSLSKKVDLISENMAQMSGNFSQLLTSKLDEMMNSLKEHRPGKDPLPSFTPNVRQEPVRSQDVRSMPPSANSVGPMGGGCRGNAPANPWFHQPQEMPNGSCAYSPYQEVYLPPTKNQPYFNSSSITVPEEVQKVGDRDAIKDIHEPNGSSKALSPDCEFLAVEFGKISEAHSISTERDGKEFSAECRDDPTPICTWSPSPPHELKEAPAEALDANAEFVTFVVFPYHVEGRKLDRTARSILTFHAYVCCDNLLHEYELKNFGEEPNSFYGAFDVKWFLGRDGFLLDGFCKNLIFFNKELKTIKEIFRFKDQEQELFAVKSRLKVVEGRMPVLKEIKSKGEKKTQMLKLELMKMEHINRQNHLLTSRPPRKPPNNFFDLKGIRICIKTFQQTVSKHHHFRTSVDEDSINCSDNECSTFEESCKVTVNHQLPTRPLPKPPWKNYTQTFHQASGGPQQHKIGNINFPPTHRQPTTTKQQLFFNPRKNFESYSKKNKPMKVKIVPNNQTSVGSWKDQPRDDTIWEDRWNIVGKFTSFDLVARSNSRGEYLMHTKVRTIFDTHLGRANC